MRSDDVEWAKFRSNNACVGVLEGVAVPCHRLAICRGLSNDGPCDNYRQFPLFVCLVCTGEQHAYWDVHWCTISYDLWATRYRKVDESVVDNAMSRN